MRETFREGGGFEEAAAYSRAVRIGQHVAVSGTAAREGGDAYTQTSEAIARALVAAEKLGAAKENVLRTRLLLAGKDVDYEGAFSPVDFDANGDIGSAVFEIWKYASAGKIDTLKTVTFRGG